MVDGMRLLVVEDEQPMAAMLHRGLTEDGYSVDVTGEGYEAVWQATEVDYDAVVLNLMLPGLDGFEVCRQLRAADRWMPVLMLTARTDVSDHIRGSTTAPTATWPNRSVSWSCPHDCAP